MDKRRRISILNDAAFMLRCSGGAVVSYFLAVSLGLQHPVWAAMSSLIVVQDNERATVRAAAARVLGTCAGIAIAVLVGSIPTISSNSTALEIGLSVGLCAAFARRYPSMRVAMWTAPLVYLSQSTGTDLWHSGLWRGLEVLLGAAIGALFHWSSARILKILA